MSINKVILVGNVGRDPEIRYLESGVAKCTFTLATSESYKNKNGEKVTNTEWHNIVIWRELAKAAETYVKKGMQLYIEGKITTRSYNDKDGNPKKITEIVADTFQMLGKRPDHPAAGEQGEKTKPETQEPDVQGPADGDDLPF
jgi:single-strand DNA-binding protein